MTDFEGDTTDRQLQIRGLEERAFNAWPALQTLISHGWLFRTALGYTKRANSVNAIAPYGEFEEVLTEAQAYYQSNGIALVFRISPLAGAQVDEKLAAAGFERFDETMVMTADLLDVAVTAGSDDVLIRSGPDEWWSAGYATASGTSEHHRATHDAILGLIQAPMACAMVVEKRMPIGFGMAVVDRGMVGLFDIVTVESERRRGAGKKIVGALLAWGKEHGAKHAYLQVMVKNAGAIRLYEKFGFQEAYRYHYWGRKSFLSTIM